MVPSGKGFLKIGMLGRAQGLYKGTVGWRIRGALPSVSHYVLVFNHEVISFLFMP